MRVTALLGILAGGGCLALEDDEPPELVIVLFWEDGSVSGAVDTETCETAGVEWASWTVTRTDGGDERVFERTEGREGCINELAFADVAPGEYTLEIRGGNDRGSMGWQGSCGQLYVDRFDELYGCEVFLTDDSGTATVPEADAGLTDAGPADAGLDDAELRDAGADAGGR